jgi:predicted enzyme related to lactoylglutathione lyase
MIVAWQKANPVYPVADIDHSVAWYRRVFGWEPGVLNPVYAVLCSNGVSVLHLVKKGAGHLSIGSPAQAQFWIDSQLDELFDEVKGRGAKIVQSPTDQPWGHRDFMVEDPDGNLVWVTARVG